MSNAYWVACKISDALEYKRFIFYAFTYNFHAKVQEYFKGKMPYFKFVAKNILLRIIPNNVLNDCL